MKIENGPVPLIRSFLGCDIVCSTQTQHVSYNTADVNIGRVLVAWRCGVTAVVWQSFLESSLFWVLYWTLMWPALGLRVVWADTALHYRQSWIQNIIMEMIKTPQICRESKVFRLCMCVIFFCILHTQLMPLERLKLICSYHFCGNRLQIRLLIHYCWYRLGVMGSPPFEQDQFWDPKTSQTHLLLLR